MSVNVKLKDLRETLNVLRTNLNETKGKLMVSLTTMRECRNVLDGEFRLQCSKLRREMAEELDECRYNHTDLVQKWTGVELTSRELVYNESNPDKEFTYEIRESFPNVRTSSRAKRPSIEMFLTPGIEFKHHREYIDAVKAYEYLDRHRASLCTQIANIERAMNINMNVPVQLVTLTNAAMVTINRAYSETA